MDCELTPYLSDLTIYALCSPHLPETESCPVQTGGMCFCAMRAGKEWLSTATLRIEYLSINLLLFNMTS